MAKLYRDLVKELNEFGRSQKDYPKLRILAMESTPAVGVKKLTFKAVVEGESSDYITYVEFQKVNYSPKKVPELDFTEPVKVERKLQYHEKIQLSKHPMSLKCTCQDFRFVFEKELYDAKSLIGRWRKYIRVPGSTRPPRNPDNKLGFCKHVNSLINSLRKSGRIMD